MTTVTAGSSGSYTFTGAQIITISPDANEAATFEVRRAGLLIAGSRTTAGQNIGPFQAGDVFTLTAQRGDMDYTVTDSPTVGGTILGPYANTTVLQAAFPAAANTGRLALVGATAPYAFYGSDGSAWSTIGGGAGNELTPATFANLPSASANAGKYIFCTDFGAAGTYLRSNGTRWKPNNGRSTLLTLETAPTITGATEAIFTGAMLLLPAGAWQQGDCIAVNVSESKVGTAGTATFQVRLGTLGTIADAALTSTWVLATTNVSGSALMLFRRASSTTVQKLGSAAVANGLAGAVTTSAYPAAVTVSNMDTNPLYLSISMVLTTATTEVVSLNQCDFIYQSSTS